MDTDEIGALHAACVALVTAMVFDDRDTAAQIAMEHDPYDLLVMMTQVAWSMAVAAAMSLDVDPVELWREVGLAGATHLRGDEDARPPADND